MKAVLYAAKSTADPHGSIETQLADGRALAEREGLEVVAEYSDEAASAFKGNRGPDLERAMAHAEREGCALIVQHSDRLARGDGRRAKHLVEYALWAIKSGVTIRSVQDSQTFGDLLYAVVTGQRNHEDSARKSKAVRDGLSRRAERGQPVGFMPLGYRAEPIIDADGKPKLRRDGKAETERVIDPTEAAMVERIYDGIENGATPGQVSKALNRDGLRTKRGHGFTTRAVRRIAENADYTGTTGYPKLIEPERFERVQAMLSRLDPAAMQRSRGGRPGTHDFLLGGGLAFCRACGAPMRSRTYRNGTRVYRCRGTTEGYGTCSSRPVPAVLVERQVLDHLHYFVADLEGWLEQKVAERTDQQRAREAAIDRERTVLAELERKVALAQAAYEKMLVEEPELAATALRQVARIEAQRDEQRSVVAQVEAAAAEWHGAPDAKAALAYYEGIVAVVDGKVTAAKGIAELNGVLASIIAGIWFELSDGRLHAEFQLRPPDGLPMVSGLAEALAMDAADRRIALPQGVVEPSEVEMVRRSLSVETEPHTFVYVHPQRRPISS